MMLIKSELFFFKLSFLTWKINIYLKFTIIRIPPLKIVCLQKWVKWFESSLCFDFLLQSWRKMEKRQFVILFLLQTLFSKGKETMLFSLLFIVVDLLDQCFSNFWSPKQIFKLLSQPLTWNTLYDHNFNHLFF